MNKHTTLIFFIALCLLFCPIVGQKYSAAGTLPPEELLEDPALEQRARALAEDLRCVVCANQSIADSEATLALDMQRFIRRELSGGAEDSEIITALIDRYGERVLLSPPVTTRTYLLWGLPAALTLLVLATLWFRRRATNAPVLAPLPIDQWEEDDQREGRG
ncbi:MAG: cytochrome c-type biogenesis protein CcmH [Alphaproteobacteria bacterium]|nr:cytochrome c-type biogenesis protein CcmH [Alphaproteobacteria bacterium SS10]